MPDEAPHLAQEPKAWYRGMSRYHWWVLIIATMGWMFDTMDQQLFNLGRGPAMKEVLGFDPVGFGLEKLPAETPRKVATAELAVWVEKGTLTEKQRAELLTDNDGNKRQNVTRKEIARVIGEDLLGPKYVELAETEKLSPYPEDSFDQEALDKLVAGEVISAENAREYLVDYDSGSIPREDLARRVGRECAKLKVSEAGDNATFILIMGWAIGGLFFGWVGDSLGRVKTMAITILMYSLFTGLNGLARTEFEFTVIRFLVALGVGGEFAAGAALVTEILPDRSRPAALGMLQAVSAGGNMIGALLAFFILPIWGWRWLFAVGAIPCVVAALVFFGLSEPQKWKQARAKWLEEKAAGITKKRASYAGLFQDHRWRNRAIVGLLLGVVGVGGLWGVGFFTPELNRSIAKNYSEEAKEQFVSIAFFLQQFGAFLGISAYTVLSLRMGRRPAFAIFFVLAFFVVSYTFLFGNTIRQAYILAPLVGFVTLGPFGGYAIYFPELFPTRLRATGTGFCYNVGRFLAALVPSAKGKLKGLFMSGWLVLPFLPAATGDAELAIRYGSFLMIFIYPIGLVVLLFAPETKGQPLPED